MNASQNINMSDGVTRDVFVIAVIYGRGSSSQWSWSRSRCVHRDADDTDLTTYRPFSDTTHMVREPNVLPNCFGIAFYTRGRDSVSGTRYSGNDDDDRGVSSLVSVQRCRRVHRTCRRRLSIIYVPVLRRAVELYANIMMIINELSKRKPVVNSM